MVSLSARCFRLPVNIASDVPHRPWNVRDVTALSGAQTRCSPRFLVLRFGGRYRYKYALRACAQARFQ